jgi:hypothetical protein
VRLPVIHRRVATHTARLAIAAGAIDFKELEHGLSLLEDTILDFEVEDRALLLERDAVLAKKRLFAWPLDAPGVARTRRGSGGPAHAAPAGGRGERARAGRERR